MICGRPRASDGQPCERQVSIGFNSCWFHGGKTPAAKHQAEKALAYARMPAIEALCTIIHEWQTNQCPVCKGPDTRGESLHPVIRAAQIILDRTGFGPKATLEVAKPEGSDLDVALLNEDERYRMSRLLKELRTLKGEIRARLAASSDGLGGEQDVPLPFVEGEIAKVQAAKLLGLGNESER